MLSRHLLSYPITWSTEQVLSVEMYSGHTVLLHKYIINSHFIRRGYSFSLLFLFENLHICCLPLLIYDSHLSSCYFLSFFPFIKHRFFSNISWIQFSLPLLIPVPPHVLSHLDPLLLCLPLERRLLRDNNKIWWDKTEATISKWDKQKSKGAPRGDTRIWDPLVYTFGVSLKY